MFQGCFKEVLRLFKVLRGVTSDHETNNKKFQGSFRNVSRKFCFAILFLNGSHRSYPSRRRDCFMKIGYFTPYGSKLVGITLFVNFFFLKRVNLRVIREKDTRNRKTAKLVGDIFA